MPNTLTIRGIINLLALVASEAADLALVGSPAEHSGIVVTPFMQDHLVVIVAAGDTWAKRVDVALEELRQRTLLTREPGSGFMPALSDCSGESSWPANQ